MRTALFSLMLLFICGCSGTAPTDGTPTDEHNTSKFSVKQFGQLSMNSQGLVRISGTGFDTNTVLRVSDQVILIDTLRANEIVFRAPWPRGSYAVTLAKADTQLTAGELNVTREALAAVDLPDGWYSMVQMKASGTPSSSGWYTWNSRGETSTFTTTSKIEQTVTVTDGIPWIEVKGDSLVGRSASIDARYHGMIDRGNARIQSFFGEKTDGSRFDGFYNVRSLSANDLDITLSDGKYILRAKGSLAFSGLNVESSTGNPRPSHSSTNYFTTPNSFVEVILEKMP